MSEILTPEQFDVQLQNIRWHAILGEDEMAASVEDLVRRHEHALRAERDRLAAEVERLRVAARDFLDHHSLDCGAHYCRYCPARSPEWKHETYCAYVRAQAAYTALSAVLAEAPKEGQ